MPVISAIEILRQKDDEYINIYMCKPKSCQTNARLTYIDKNIGLKGKLTR